MRLENSVQAAANIAAGGGRCCVAAGYLQDERRPQICNEAVWCRRFTGGVLSIVDLIPTRVFLPCLFSHVYFGAFAACLAREADKDGRMGGNVKHIYQSVKLFFSTF